METTEKEYRQVRKVARSVYREAQKALEEQQRQINAKQHQLREEFKKRMGALHDMYNQTTEHSIKNHRMREAYNIKRFIGGKLSEWQSSVIDVENAGIGFEIKEDCIQIGITIPYKDPRVRIDENQG